MVTLILLIKDSECSNRMAALLEYLDCTMIIHTFLHYNQVAVSSQPLKDSSTLTSVDISNFQLIYFSGLSGIRVTTNF